MSGLPIGDCAYDWEHWSTGESQVRAVKWQTDAWRVARFAGLNPWLHALGHYGLMPLETVILRRVPTVFNAGETTNLEAYILNDTLRDCAYRVSWQITTDKGPLAEGKGDFEIPGGEMEAFSLLLSVSKVSTVGSVRETAFRYRTPMVKRQLERDPAMAGVDYRVKERVIRRPA